MTHRNKFGAERTNGYDSKREAKRAWELQLLEREGMISDLKYQVEFELVPAQRGDDGKVIEKSVAYRADFTYLENGALVVEDSKGARTKDYIIKRKLLLFRHGLRIREV